MSFLDRPTSGHRVSSWTSQTAPHWFAAGHPQSLVWATAALILAFTWHFRVWRSDGCKMVAVVPSWVSMIFSELALPVTFPRQSYLLFFRVCFQVFRAFLPMTFYWLICKMHRLHLSASHSTVLTCVFLICADFCKAEVWVWLLASLHSYIPASQGGKRSWDLVHPE